MGVAATGCARRRGLPTPAADPAEGGSHPRHRALSPGPPGLGRRRQGPVHRARRAPPPGAQALRLGRGRRRRRSRDGVAGGHVCAQAGADAPVLPRLRDARRTCRRRATVARRAGSSGAHAGLPLRRVAGCARGRLQPGPRVADEPDPHAGRARPRPPRRLDQPVVPLRLGGLPGARQGAPPARPPRRARRSRGGGRQQRQLGHRGVQPGERPPPLRLLRRRRLRTGTRRTLRRPAEAGAAGRARARLRRARWAHRGPRPAAPGRRPPGQQRRGAPRAGCGGTACEEWPAAGRAAAALGRRTLAVYVLHVPVLAALHAAVAASGPAGGTSGAVGTAAVATYPLAAGTVVVGVCLLVRRACRGRPLVWLFRRPGAGRGRAQSRGRSRPVSTSRWPA